MRFKFRCNILISGKIIKELPSLVGSGTPGIILYYITLHYITLHYVMLYYNILLLVITFMLCIYHYIP